MKRRANACSASSQVTAFASRGMALAPFGFFGFGVFAHGAVEQVELINVRCHRQWVFRLGRRNRIGFVRLAWMQYSPNCLWRSLRCRQRITQEQAHPVLTRAGESELVILVELGDFTDVPGGFGGFE